jgi:imidazolonepropionase-like amidohydrolase
MLSTAAWAADPATIAITGARIVTVSGPTIERGTIVLAGGRIAAVGADVGVPAGATVIDGSGKTVYPGLIDGLTTLGLTEIGSVAGSVDTSEVGDVNPHAKAWIAVHPHSDLIPVARANGVTTVLAGFEGSLVSGQSAIIHLDGWTPREMSVRDAAALHVTFPNVPAEIEKLKDEPLYKELRGVFEAAQRYDMALSRGSKVDRDLKLEAMRPYVRGERPVVIRAYGVREIRAAVAFGEEFKLKIVLRGATEAWKVATLLAEKKVPVLIESLGLPVQRHDPYDTGYSNAARLHKAGVRFAIVSDEPSNVRNLPYHAGMAVAYGLPPDEALKAITIYPAQIFGVDHEIGSLEEGKVADFVVTTGDPLEIVTDVVYVFIAGRPSSLVTRHTLLYEKFRARVKKNGKSEPKDD